MNTIRVSKELLINLGNFSNIKIVAELTTTELSEDDAWKLVNAQIAKQETLERENRLAPKPQVAAPAKPDNDIW